MAAENIRRVQHEDDLEQRDHEITEMKTAVEKMKVCSLHCIFNVLYPGCGK